MVKHIVIFKLKDNLTLEKKKQVITDFKKGIEDLPATIPFIRQVYVGSNINEDEMADICLESTFDTLADIRSYSAHPAHQAVAGRLKPFVAQRICADYEI